MRRFVVIGHRATTSPDFSLDDLAGSTGRLDILLRCINSAFFLSHSLREDVEMHLILQGPPNPPKTIRMVGSELKYLNPDERSTGALIRTALSAKANGETKASPGIYVSSRSYSDVISILAKQSDIYYLKEDGHDIRRLPSFEEDVTFVLGDDRDLTEEEESVLAKYEPMKVSLGIKSLHADHCIIIVHNELDRRSSQV
ncbi:MAG: tRNA (pseudouridine(54)-N(1))-methyltransferase TrmY [Thermoplasmata archaeon]|nr:tRNA (pseudouridine(54)-N(1))-methyltransferase TrmY [Thermoplasmata archaeon]